MFPSALFLLAALPSVLGHGFVNKITISSGASSTGPSPGSNADAKSAIREISENSPVKGTDNPALNCGTNAQIAGQVLDAQPGDSVSFSWVAGGGQKWPHNTGPMLTYMASCGDVECNKFDSASAKWFKIDQVGRKANGDWAQVDLFNSKEVAVNVPATLAAGNYLIRHEIIALHLAQSVGGAEFYPSCAQLRVGGSQTGAPSADELVSFPGAYGASDAGILTPDIYNTAAKYVFPGPPVAKLAATSSGSSGSGSSSSSSASSSATATGKATASASATAAPASESSEPASCKLKKVTKRNALKAHARKRLSQQ